MLTKVTFAVQKGSLIDQALIEKPDIGVKSAAKLKKMIEDAI